MKKKKQLKNRVSLKRLRRILNRKANRALKQAFRLALRQIKMRPRIRLFVSFLAMLVIGFLVSSQAVAYLKPKEVEIKIGDTLLVAQEKHEEIEPPVEIAQAVSYKRSPFEFNRPVEGYISQGYNRYHRAFDLASDFGAKIKPVGSGVVEFAGRVADGKGNVVVVDHGDGLKSLYAHMAKIEVGAGNVVSSTTVLGTVGLTGRTTGPHLHLEIYDRDVAIDPRSVLPQ